MNNNEYYRKLRILRGKTIQDELLLPYYLSFHEKIDKTFWLDSALRFLANSTILYGEFLTLSHDTQDILLELLAAKLCERDIRVTVNRV
jgi:hypothetical protein